MPENSITVSANASIGELHISAPNTRQTLDVTNNKAKYYAEQAKQYRDEAKYYAKENSDVTLGYVNQIKTELEGKIDGKQASGNYALTSDIPTKVSQLQNDSEFVNTTTFNNVINGVKLPAQTGNSGKYLTTDGTSPSWVDFTGADTDLSNLTSTGEKRLHTLKGYEDAGELLTDAEGLADVINYAHSTFDISKFTLIGSPAITNDGIASGFGNNVCIAKSLNFSSAKTWEIQIPFRTASSLVSDSKRVFDRNTAGASNYILVQVLNNLCRINLTVAGSQVVYATDSTTFSIATNTNYIVKIGYDGTQYYCKYSTNGGEFINVKAPVTSSTLWSGAQTHYIGYGAVADQYFNGSIDLKQFSIKVDGVPVFSGNKTGIDTIKPNDYTIVGSPTISADGIANATTNNYPKSPTINFSTASSWKIKTKFKTPTTAIEQSLYSGLTNPIITVVYGTSQKFRFAVGDGSNWFLTNTEGTHTFSLGTEYEVSFEFDGANYTLYVDGVQEATDASSSKITDTPLLFGVNRSGASVSSPNGTVDLNAFQVYVDGDLVYQPCLLIPYTQSKTGSKIVDSHYRNRVTDMYNQYGYAPYYTLSDSDFTLPEGEIYGMINRKLDYTNKTEISAWGFPDYNNAISIDITNIDTTNTDFTLPADGYLDINLTVTNGAEVFYVDDKPIFWWYSSSGSTTGWSTPIPIYSGTHTFKTSSQTSRVTSVVFYPMKGAN